MKQICLLLLIFLTTLRCYGQKEHLNPAKYYSNDVELKAYYDTVFPLLYGGFNNKPYALYAALPSFSGEYAFSVEQNKDGYFVLSNSLSKNYWYARRRRRVNARFTKIEIDEALYKSIGGLFQLLAKQTRTPEARESGGDGTTYFFTTIDSSGAIKTGETWSPNKESLLARLVIICDNIFSMSQGYDISQSDAIAEIKQLTIDLQQ